MLKQTTMPLSAVKEGEDEEEGTDTIPHDSNNDSCNNDVNMSNPANVNVGMERGQSRTSPTGSGADSGTGAATESNAGGDMNSSSGSGTTSRSSSKPGGYSADCSSLSNFSEDSASDGTGNSNGKSPGIQIGQKSSRRNFKSKKNGADEELNRNGDDDPSCISTPEKQEESKVKRERGDDDDKSLSSDESRHSNTNTVDVDMRMITRPNQNLPLQLNDDDSTRRNLHQDCHETNERNKVHDAQSADQGARRTSNELPYQILGKKQNQGQVNNNGSSIIDPRIDVRCVKIVSARDHDKHTNNDVSMDSNTPSPERNNHDKKSSSFGIGGLQQRKHDVFMTSYSQLLDSCKPFFNAFPSMNSTNATENSTTTTQQKNDRHGSSSADHPLEKSPSVCDTPQSRNISSSLPRVNKTNVDDTDELSMVVLARPRHKHKRGGENDKNTKSLQRTSSSNDTSSSSSLTSKQNREIQLLIQRGNNAMHNNSNENANIAAEILHMNQQLREQHRQQQQNRRQDDPGPGRDESSSSARTPHVVTASGTGSGTASGIGSGTGSGNDSSRYKNGHALTGVDGNNAVTISDMGMKVLFDHQTSQSVQNKPNNKGDKHDIEKTDEDRNSTQERLALKKRKRMDKRREYEKEVKRQAQSSSDDSTVEKIFPPGEHVSMEESLSFTKTARLIVQSAPPYYVVHINAAFSRLTGVQNDSIVGVPVSKTLSLVQSSLGEKQLHHQRNGNAETQKTPKMSSKSIKHASSNDDQDGSDLSGNQIQRITVSHENAAQTGMRVANQEREDFTLERLFASNQFGSVHKVNCREIRDDTILSDGSKNSSISSKETPRSPTPCIMSVCPVLNSPISHSSSMHYATDWPSTTHPRRSRTKGTASTHLIVQLFTEDDIQVAGNHHNLPTDIRGDGRAEDNDGEDSGDSSLSNPSPDPPVVTCG